MTQVVFHTPARYSARGAYELLPFRFIRLDDRMVCVNEVGEYELLEQNEFHQFVKHSLSRLQMSTAISKPNTSSEIQNRSFRSSCWPPNTATKRAFLEGFTRLHIFVVTLRCDHSCPTIARCRE